MFKGKIKKVSSLESSDAGIPYGQDAVFIGWYTDKNYTVEWNPDQPIISDTELYGKWENAHFPKAGDLITIEGVDADGVVGKLDVFRVLDIDGANFKLLAMSGKNIAYSQEHATVKMKDMNGNETDSDVIKYDGSTLDIYLNTTYFNKLPENIQSAIQDSTFTQYAYKFTTYDDPGAYKFEMNFDPGTSRYAIRQGYVDKDLTRKVYAMDVEEVFKYGNKLGTDDNCMTSEETNKMFFDKDTTLGKYAWISSADSKNSEYAWFVRGDHACLETNKYNNSAGPGRPVFTINVIEL